MLLTDPAKKREILQASLEQYRASLERFRAGELTPADVLAGDQRAYEDPRAAAEHWLTWNIANVERILAGRPAD